MIEKAEFKTDQGVCFLGTSFSNPAQLLQTIKRNNCPIAESQENNSEHALSVIREAAANIVAFKDKPESDLIPFFKKMIKANQLIEGGFQLRKSWHKTVTKKKKYDEIHAVFLYWLLVFAY
jgi:hypothetical protein